MPILHRFRIPIVLFVIGLIVSLIGAWLKIIHYEDADIFLAGGMALEAAALVSAIIIFFISTKKSTQ